MGKLTNGASVSPTPDVLCFGYIVAPCGFIYFIYCKTSGISHTKSQNLNVSCILLQLSSENEDVVGAAPTGDAPTTSELSTILLPTKVRLILEFYGTYILQDTRTMIPVHVM